MRIIFQLQRFLFNTDLFQTELQFLPGLYLKYTLSKQFAQLQQSKQNHYKKHVALTAGVSPTVVGCTHQLGHQEG